MLNLTHTEVMGRAHYKELGEELGFSFGEVDEDLGIPLGAGRGDRFSYTEQSARLKNISLKQACLDTGERYYDVKLYSDALVQYKRMRLLKDFTDMLQEYRIGGPVPPLEAVIVDEGQDLSPLQWRVVEKIWAGVPKVYIAGDDDQAI